MVYILGNGFDKHIGSPESVVELHDIGDSWFTLAPKESCPTYSPDGTILRLSLTVQYI